LNKKIKTNQRYLQLVKNKELYKVIDNHFNKKTNKKELKILKDEIVKIVLVIIKNLTIEKVILKIEINEIFQNKINSNLFINLMLQEKLVLEIQKEKVMRLKNNKNSYKMKRNKEKIVEDNQRLVNKMFRKLNRLNKLKVKN